MVQTQVVEIKRYGNRKLYRPDQSRYVNLTELLQVAKDGAKIHVVDARTQADITSETLLKAAVAGGVVTADQVLNLIRTAPTQAKE